MHRRRAAHGLLLLCLPLLAACGSGGGGPTVDTSATSCASPGNATAFTSPPSDPLYATRQWHLQNTGQFGATPGQDARVQGAWALGYTGAGVQLVVIDDGVDIGHPDLFANVLTGCSLNLDDGSTDPTPAPGSGPNSAAHGTSVAGVAAAVGDNGLGVTGAAPRAGLIGVRDNQGTDLSYATAVRHVGVSAGVYNMSFGPPDDGGVYPFTASQTAAIDAGISMGRGGRGSIYVVAAGNGGMGDYANLDGSQNHRGMITVGAVTAQGVAAGYNERSASTLVCAPSNGGSVGITTTDVSGGNGYETPPGDYMQQFGGTSSAAPLVSGIVALLLDANPNLTWRDVRRILVNTARQVDPGNPDWGVNGAGRMVSHIYGYGVIDAAAAVAAAPGFPTLGATPFFFAPPPRAPALAIPDAGVPVGDILMVGGSGITAADYVAVRLTVAHAAFQDLRVTLTSPSGTVSILSDAIAAPASGVQPAPANLLLATNHLIGEPVDGTWTLAVQDLVAGTSGTFDAWQLIVYGD